MVAAKHASGEVRAIDAPGGDLSESDAAATSAPQHEESVTGPRWREVLVVVTALLVGVLWVGRRLRRTYFYFDEWSMIGRVTELAPLEGATTSFNGHLWFFQDVIFRFQAKVFGLDSNLFIVILFLVALATLHLSIGMLAVRVGVPLVPAMMLAGLLTYLGPATQNFIFAIQVSPVFATAAAMGCAALVLGKRDTTTRTVLAAALLLLAVLFDSAVGLLALTLGGALLVQVWPRRRWWALVPSVLVMAWWYVFADLGPQFPASVQDRITFAVRLVMRASGALIGGGVWSGALVLFVFGVASVVAIRSRRVTAAQRAVAVAGALALLISVAGISQSRAGLPGFTFFENNRYLQNVALPLVVMFLPALVAASGVAADRIAEWNLSARPLLVAVPIVVMSGAFVLGLDEERRYADVFIERTEIVRAGVLDTATVIEQGCPSGGQPDPAARPLGSISPQISTQLVADLLARELLVAPGKSVDDVDPAVLAAICAG